MSPHDNPVSRNYEYPHLKIEEPEAQRGEVIAEGHRLLQMAAWGFPRLLPTPCTPSGGWGGLRGGRAQKWQRPAVHYAEMTPRPPRALSLWSPHSGKLFLLSPWGNLQTPSSWTPPSSHLLSQPDNATLPEYLSAVQIRLYWTWAGICVRGKGHKVR